MKWFFPENIKLFCWRIIYTPFYRIKYIWSAPARKQFSILDSPRTVKYIISHRCSVSRFGDGEMAMIYHLLSGGTSDNFYINSFQKYKQELAIKLKRILDSGPKEDFKVAIPYSILSTKDYIGVERVFWERFVILDIKRFQTLLKKDYLYLNSCFTRFYLNHRRSDFQQYVNLLKTIWAGKELCIIEGKNSRLGVGNDLFENAASIVRILCPTTDAFDKYNEILSEALRQPKEKLFLIALGHTATVLAYELYSHGYWAIDIGHVDIEYEWFLRHATKKVSVSGKYINEIPEGRVFDECDDQEYLNQIVVAIDN